MTLELVPDDASREFYASAERGRLSTKRCLDCRRWATPDQRTCAGCGRTRLDWAEVSGRATLVTWSVVHQPPHPALAADVPYVCGIVELDEGPWLYARLVDVADPAAGDALEVSFLRADGSATYPVFRPRG